MTPERWSEVERVCHAALSHDPHERAAFIAEQPVRATPRSGMKSGRCSPRRRRSGLHEHAGTR